MKKHLAIICWAAAPARPEMCATPFFHAAAAAAMDVDVEIFFTSASVLLLKRGVADALSTGPRRAATVYSFMQEAARLGARFYACSQAMAEHGLDRKDLVPELTGVAGAATYVARTLDEDWANVVY